MPRNHILCHYIMQINLLTLVPLDLLYLCGIESPLLRIFRIIRVKKKINRICLCLNWLTRLAVCLSDFAVLGTIRPLRRDCVVIFLYPHKPNALLHGLLDSFKYLRLLLILCHFRNRFDFVCFPRTGKCVSKLMFHQSIVVAGIDHIRFA